MYVLAYAQILHVYTEHNNVSSLDEFISYVAVEANLNLKKSFLYWKLQVSMDNLSRQYTSNYHNAFLNEFSYAKVKSATCIYILY